MALIGLYPSRVLCALTEAPPPIRPLSAVVASAVSSTTAVLGMYDFRSSNLSSGGGGFMYEVYFYFAISCTCCLVLSVMCCDSLSSFLFLMFLVFHHVHICCVLPVCMCVCASLFLKPLSPPAPSFPHHGQTAVFLPFLVGTRRTPKVFPFPPFPLRCVRSFFFYRNMIFCRFCVLFARLHRITRCGTNKGGIRQLCHDGRAVVHGVLGRPLRGSRSGYPAVEIPRAEAQGEDRLI